MAKLPCFPVVLNANKDRFGNTYYMGTIRAPMAMNFKEGIAFVIFLSEEGQETLNIDCAKEGSWCQYMQRKLKDGEIDSLRAYLEKKKDQNGKPFYVAVVQDDSLVLNLQHGYSFFVFNSAPGDEQIQIRKFISDQNGRDRDDEHEIRQEPRRGPEVLYQNRKDSSVHRREEAGPSESGSHVKVEVGPGIASTGSSPRRSGMTG